MKKQLILALALGLTLGCEEKSGGNGTFTDSRDSKVYKWVKIGTQTWMAENLNYKFENTLDSSGYCYKNDTVNCEVYGRLYNGCDVKVCPSGWHLPTIEEWKILVDFAGGEKVAGKKLKAKNGWNEKFGDGTDDYGFSALPGGSGYYCESSECGCDSDPADCGLVSERIVGEAGVWWSATKTYYSDEESNVVSYLAINGDSGEFEGSNTCLLTFYSVRCLKD